MQYVIGLAGAPGERGFPPTLGTSVVGITLCDGTLWLEGLCPFPSSGARWPGPVFLVVLGILHADGRHWIRGVVTRSFRNRGWVGLAGRPNGGSGIGFPKRSRFQDNFPEWSCFVENWDFLSGRHKSAGNGNYDELGERIWPKQR